MKLADKYSHEIINSTLRFGMVQGRLIKSPQNLLQWFPQPYWEAEFFVAGALGFDYIELLAEREHNPENPIWTAEGVERLKKVVDLAGLTLPVFCNDYIIDNPLPDNKECLEQNLRLIERGALIGCDKYLLPLFEQSELTMQNLSAYIQPLRILADACAAAGVELCLETILKGIELIDALEQINRPAISVVFDTGNRIAFGHDLGADIRLLGSRISHMHIKDKNAANQNVVLGTGQVNFQEVFEALAAISYDGLYTFETNRGKNPTRTAAYNKQLITYFHSESFLTK
jgi:sugar phosphate isomerase/epimerase